MILLTDFDQQLQGLSTGSPPPPPPPPPLPLLIFFFFTFFPKQRACSQARIYYANRTTAGEVLLVRHYSAVNSPG